MDNPGSVIATELDDRLDRTTDPVAITVAQIRFDDNLTALDSVSRPKDSSEVPGFRLERVLS